VAGARPQALFAQTAGRVPSASDPASPVVRRAILTVSEKVLAGDLVVSAEAHLFNLFPDVEIVAMRNRVESRSSRDYSWFGYIPGDSLGHAIVTVVNGSLGALVEASRKRYVVLPIGNGQHEAVEIDTGSFPEGDDTRIEPLVQAYAIGTGGAGGTRTTTQIGATSVDADGMIRLLDLKFALWNGNVPSIIAPTPDDGSLIDITVVYTHGAARLSDPTLVPPTHTSASHPSPLNLLTRLQLAIDELNWSLEYSGVLTRVRRIGDPAEEIVYQENGKMGVDLAAVRNGQLTSVVQYGEFKSVYRRRDDLAADLVVLLTSGGTDANGQSLCGLTKTKELGTDASFNAAMGFIVLKSTCLGHTVNLAHQFGHAMGTTHDWYRYLTANESLSVGPQAHGFITKLPPQYPYNSLRMRSIMAYSDYCTQVLGIPKNELDERCHHGPWWSNQTQTQYIGAGVPEIPMGGAVPEVPISAIADEVPTLNGNRMEVANYRHSICRAMTTC
jgi:hypothetical protein